MSTSTRTSNQRILFVYDRNLASFMARDWDIIRARWPRSELFRWRGWRDTWRLGHRAMRADLVFCWFGASHALAAALTNVSGKPLVIVAGGWDVARLPEIGYGAHSHFPQAPLSRLLFARATRVLAVSEFTAREAVVNAGVLRERIQVIHHGFDPSSWPAGNSDRPIDVLTVGSAGTIHAPVKGLDLLIDTAARLPDVGFELVGVGPEDLKRTGLPTLPENLRSTGTLDSEALRERYRSARVYLQPSRQESFGCALAEAMLSGCVPVVPRRGAMPEVVGDAGYYVDRMLPQEFARAVSEALQTSEQDRERARARIEQEFHIDRYADRLVACLDEVLR